jgi:hypothetical protein
MKLAIADEGTGNRIVVAVRLEPFSSVLSAVLNPV